MIISTEDRFSDVKKRFQGMFPGLKIDFYKKKHESFEGSTSDELYKNNMKISEVANLDKTTDLKIDEDQTVAEVEKMFEDKMGLHVQIFRRSNDLWLQTTTTDEWTLKTQNRKGIHSTQQ